MQSLADILAILKEKKQDLASKYPIASLAVFGSYARGEATNDSDIDIVVEFSGPVGFKFFHLALDLERFLGVKVDLVSKRGVKEKYLRVIENDFIYV